MAEKTGLVTGAAGGIGLAVAREFVRSNEYSNMILVDRPGADLNKAAVELVSISRGCRINSLFFDISLPYPETEQLISSIAQSVRNIDVLVNVAGIAPNSMAPLVKTDIEASQKIMDVNFWGTAKLCRAVLPLMQANGFGRIVNITSISAFMEDPGNSIYSASKAAVWAFTRALAKEATFNKADPSHPLDVTVNAVAPGIVDTPMARQLSQKMIDSFIAATPLGRLIKPEEVAEAIFKLAVNKSKKTGKVVFVDGGYLKQKNIKQKKDT